MTTEQKHEIEIPGLPEGWRAVAYRIPNFGEYYVDSSEKITEYRGGHGFKKLIVERIKPRRIVLEETEEKHLGCQTLYIDDTEFMIMTDKVWREVKETDTPLNNSEPKLSLSVDECKEAMRKLETFNVTDLSVKICRFLKEHS